MSTERTGSETMTPMLDLKEEQHHLLRIDPHSHILPGIDDGAPNLEVSLSMARRAAGLGMEIVVATPHACHPAVRCPITADILRERVQSLNHAIQGAGLSLQVLPGQEFLMDEKLPQMFEAGELITWADQGRYVLVELGFHKLPGCAWDVLDYFASRGLTALLAHPERYTWWEDEPHALSRLLDRGCFFQLNVMSLNKLWGEEAFERALYFMDHVPHWIVGTDAHNDADRFWGVQEVRALVEARANTVAFRPAWHRNV